ncbi:MAG: CHASE2 domain-containing protein, partial [Treponema sp.]|nr:CHASE2 domain-containing protein [Treponema sp.]
MLKPRNVLTGLVPGLVFALLYAAGALEAPEDRVYDFFLRGRQNRARLENVVFLDVDDDAIAYNGVFPWPRSVMADGFLRLKEYGAAAGVMDVEFIDKGPEGVDSVYLNRDLPVIFDRTFTGVGAGVSDLAAALRSGRITGAQAEQYEEELQNLLFQEREELFRRTSAIARDNDIYLAQAAALFGRTWATLTLQTLPLSGEQAERRPLAEERFSYPVDAAPGAQGGDYADVLPAVPVFARSVRGAGFTNVFIDGDGVRRRISLACKVNDHWYLQLALAPLVEYLGSPAIRLEKGRLVLQDARLPAGGSVRDIVIPLDAQGRMMLDWPKTSYRDSFTHVSFAEFSRLEELETQIEQYLVQLGDAQFSFFAQFDGELSPAAGLVYQADALFTLAREERARALEEQSGEAFDAYLGFRSQAMGLIQDVLDMNPGPRVRILAGMLAGDYPEDAVRDEAEYIAVLTEYLADTVERCAAAGDNIRRALEGKFCIIGRTDTGTTDIGVNPFYGEYINVGTHAVVMDTILQESFIRPLSPLWSAVLCPVFSLLLTLSLGGLKPVSRAAAGLGGAALPGLCCFVLFRYTGIFAGPLGPVLSAFIAVILRELVSYMVSEKEKQFINRAFSTYVSKEVVEELVANPSLLQLGGSKRRMSAVFTDIQNFSTISEQLAPEQLVQLLNRYLTVMSNIIMENMGTIDKYEGDAIIAFFGAPLYRENHAALACRSALLMKKAEKELNRQLMEQGLIPGRVLDALKNEGVRLDPQDPVPLYTRLGINTGEMVVGNMGTSGKMNYTIMGNAVNLSARLEGVNKQYHTGGITISEYTRGEIGDDFICRSLDRVRVVGISAPVRIYELLGLRSETGAAEFDVLAVWEEAVRLYENREFRRAAERFGSIAVNNKKDITARLYAGRCRHYIAAPPP